MAITFRGSASSYAINGNDLTTQGLFTIENAPWSQVTVKIRRLIIQNDGVSLLTSVMPLVKASRAVAVPTGGVILPKIAFDKAQISNAGVTIRSALSWGFPLTASAGNTLWQQYTTRAHTAAEQRLGVDNPILPAAIENRPLILTPGQYLLLQVIGAVAASNSQYDTNWFAQAVWEEDSLGSFAISGTVTLGGAPVDGAKIIVMEATDESLSDARLVEVVTTNALGQWSSSIGKGLVGAAFVQYVTGGTYYTAPGSPFLEEP